MSLLSSLQNIVKLLKGAKKYDNLIFQSMKVTEACKGKVKCQFLVEENHLNTGGSLHGGCTATIVDNVSTLAFLTLDDAKPGVSLDINVSYLKAVKPGETITICSDVLKESGNIRFATVDIFNESGDIVACGRHSKSMK